MKRERITLGIKTLLETLVLLFFFSFSDKFVFNIYTYIYTRFFEDLKIMNFCHKFYCCFNDIPKSFTSN